MNVSFKGNYTIPIDDSKFANKMAQTLDKKNGVESYINESGDLRYISNFGHLKDKKNITKAAIDSNPPEIKDRILTNNNWVVLDRINKVFDDNAKTIKD